MASGFTIIIEVDDKAVTEGLREMQRRAVDQTPVWKAAKEVLKRSKNRTFEAEGRPDGWEPRAESTLRQIEESGRGYNKVLQRSGHLKKTIAEKSDKTGVEQGVALDYAAIHQFGGKAGRGHKVTIPARPYLVIQDEDLEEIEGTILDYLAKPMS